MIVNLQRKLKLDTKAFASFLKDALAAIPETGDGTASVAFISDRRMKELNGFFRGKDSTTDVLSFPHEPDEFEQTSRAFANEDDGTTEAAAFLGDIVISAEQASRQAKENKLTLEREIRQLILHGLLHLCGYDHETDDGEMDRREIQLRKELGI